MNREDEFDLRLARWLEDGPFEAPDRPIEAAIEHARAHPRRWFSRAALWRSAMTRMQLTHVVPPENHLGRMLAAGIAVVAIVVIALVGSGALKLNPSEPAPAIVAAPTATATIAPTTAPVVPVKVTGTTSCTKSSDGTTTTAMTNRGEVVAMRGIVFTCDYSGYFDSRIRGTSNVNANVDEFSGDDDSGNIWGTEIITTPDGHWSGSITGIIDKGYGTHRVAAVLLGSGAYAGLQFRYTMTSEDQGATTAVIGTIEGVPSFTPSAPVTAPIAVTGTEACGSFGGTRTTVGGVEQVRGEGSSCTEDMSDPRGASTRSTRTYDYDILPDGTAKYWGIGEVSNAGGTWTGVWTGSVDKAGTFRVDAAAFAGSGGYAGLQFRLTAVWPKDAGSATLSGTISPIQ